jgi:AcrR family transcriptional regulator
MRKTDPRVIRTRQMLRDAMVATVLEKGYDATNIQDITERAGLRRATFYLHYRDKEELLVSMIHETIDDLIGQLQITPQDILNPEIQQIGESITFAHVEKNADLYRAILSGQGAAEITRSVRDYLAAGIRERCFLEQSESDLPIPIDILANYMAAVKLNMIIWWLEKGMPYTSEQMAEMCTRLVLNGAAGVLGVSPIRSEISVKG